MILGEAQKKQSPEKNAFRINAITRILASFELDFRVYARIVSRIQL